jgi:hypothetical protein
MTYPRSRTFVLRVLLSFVFALAVVNNIHAAELNDDEKLLREIDKLLFNEPSKPAPASITVNIGGDSETGKNYFTSLSLPVFEQRLLLTGGNNTADNSETGEEESSSSYSIGVFSSAKDKLGLGVEYRSWTFEDIVEINALRGTVELNFPDIYFSLTPQFRNIEYHDTLVTAGGPRELDIHIDSYGYNMNLVVYMPADFWISGAYASHSYNDEIFALGARRSFFEIAANEESLLRLSPAILNSTYGLEKTRTGASIGLDFKEAGISLGWSESVSAIDEEKTTTTDGSIYWYMDRHWRLKVSGGSQTNSVNNNQITFATLSIKYRF